MAIEFSLVIPTINSMGVIERLVQALEAQEFEHDFEVIFMDSCSTDGTLEYLDTTQFINRQIVKVPVGQFSHSGTRMDAARLAQGRFVIYFTHDMVPIGKNFLTELTKPVLQGIAPASYGVFQIDPLTSDPVDAYLHNGWHEGVAEVVGPVSQFCWEQFPPHLRRRLSNFDDCASCIDRDLLLQLEFPRVPYGEDMLLAKRLLLSGHKIALSKNAKFHHWHKVSFTYLMKRMCIDQHLSIEEFDLFYVRRKLGVVKAIGIRVLQRAWIAFFCLRMPFSKKVYWTRYNVKVLTADFLGKYIGTLNENNVAKYDLIDQRLLRAKSEILEEIDTRSIGRY
jgi:rhamnosyltransferase